MPYSFTIYECVDVDIAIGDCDFVSKCVKVKGFVFKFKLYISHYCHDQSFKV